VTVRAHTNYSRTVRCPCGVGKASGAPADLSKLVTFRLKCGVCGRVLVERSANFGSGRARFAFLRAHEVLR
jgi:hypothetical protein